MKKQQKRMTCGFSPALYAAVQSAAQDEDLSFSEYVESVMNEKMEQMKAYKPRPAAYWRRLTEEPSGGVSFRIKVDADAWRHLTRRRKAKYLATGTDEEPCERIEALIKTALKSEMTKHGRRATTPAGGGDEAAPDAPAAPAADTTTTEASKQ